jgi:outer membrane protein assembly factor BamB
MIASVFAAITLNLGPLSMNASGAGSLEVEVTSHFSILNSAAQSAITVHVIDGANPVQGANVNLTTDNGGIFSPQNGTTDSNGNFTSIFNAPTVTTQINCRITAEANKTGYSNGSGYVDITINPIPWPMFRHNLNNTGLSPYDTSANPGKLKWSYETGGNVHTTPAIGSDGSIYIGSKDNKLYAINPDGTEKWNFTTGDKIRWSSAAIGSDGTIYVGSHDTKLYAINPDGTEKWNFTTGVQVDSPPAIGSDGTIYFGSDNCKLYAINPDGTEKWNFTTGGLVKTAPAIGLDGTIYICSWDHKLYAINPNGTEKWSFTTGSDARTWPAIGSDGTIYFGSTDNNLYAINPDGTEKWNFTTGSGMWSSPAIGSDGTIYLGSYDNKLYAINPDGTEKWNFATGGVVYSSPAISSEGTIYFSSNVVPTVSKLFAIYPDGSEKWNFTLGGTPISSPAIGSDGTIYIGSDFNITGGKLYAIGRVTLPDLWVTSSDIVFYPDSPVVNGTSVKINATIHNVGTMDASNIKVSFYNGDPTLGGTLIGVNQTIPLLLIGENNTVNVTWLPPSHGTYEIYVAVDYPPPGNVIESNETNNIASKALEVIDILPPVITNLQPPDTSTTNDNTPTISADYNDPSGINVSSVLLEVDGIDVTSSATVAVSNVVYIPGMALSDGIHTVYLEVEDNVGNLATTTWSFTIDTTPPTIILIAPGNNSVIPDGTTLNFTVFDLTSFQVNYSINGGADIPFSDPFDISTTGWVDGDYVVQINALDFLGHSNSSWYFFTIDSSPPVITNLQPPNSSTTNDNTSTISADYSDPSGINVSSVVLKVDGIDVTSSVTVIASNVTYIPGTALSEGSHTIYLEVKDNIGNIATITWTFTVDSTPPIITNLQPPDTSTTNDSIPIISADYSDPSGINVSSVLLEVDGIDVTLSATVTASGVIYTPGTILLDGVHTVYLEVMDTVGNLATATWSFTVDSTPPIITNLQPPDASITNDNTTTISVDYSDPSGINTSSVMLKVDGIDVTSSATVTANGVSYIPGTVLSDSIHTVYLEVKDNYGNLATATWTFTVDTLPPIITNLQPPDSTTTNDSTPIIGGNYTDISGINLSSVLLEVDGIDVTSFATITVSNVSYLPGMALSEGIHTVYLEVRDNVGNLAIETWSFTVDTVPPIITNLQPPDASTTNDSIPIISADYSDSSGINVSSVLLMVDGIDVTSSAAVTTSGVIYIPTMALSDGIHTVYLEVRDIYGNLATGTWTFTVDTAPPIITDLQPPDTSTTNDSIPTISTDYNDLSGINVSSVMLKVDGIDVTSSTTVTASSVSYTSVIALSDGNHTVYLEVKDNVGNLAIETWSFIVDTAPPTITNLQPPDASMTNDNASVISADYSDLSGIDVGSVVLKVDGQDMTSSAMVNATNVTYLPGTALSDGIHTGYLEVRDNVNNLATATWSFTVDTTPPITTISPDIYTVKLGTLFTLMANDGVGGCGVNYTQYRIDNGQWIDFSAPFSIDSYGYHNITFRSEDNLGNVENENTLPIYVPEAPITTLIIGSPQYGTTPRYVNYSTQFSFSVIDYSGTGYNTYYYIDSLPPILYIGPITVSTEGTHAIYFYTIDNLGNIEDTKEFEIIIDNTPPTTDIVIGDPCYVSKDTWVTSVTEFTLSATDGGLIPVGVNHTMYRIWNGGVWTSWNTYAGGFSLGTNDGLSYLEFYSIDWLGNGEPSQNRTVIVDNTPPTTMISVGDPKYKDSPNDIWNVTSATTFTLSSIDEGAGLNYTEYRIWDNGSWYGWYKYTGEFRLDLDNGTRYVEWFSVDFLDNKGMTQNQTYFVDNIPPETNYLLLIESDNTEARLSLIPNDVGSGIDITKYRIDSGDWINYSSTFVINESGEHVIYFWSSDKLGNIEKTKEVSVLVEKPETPVPSDGEYKETNNKPLIALIFSIILLLVGSYVSYKRPLSFKGEVTRDRLLTWLIVVLPFVIAEIITGVVSLTTGVLSVPPLLGVGMIVDTAILMSGSVTNGYIYKKGQKASTGTEQFMDREVEEKES